MERQILEFVLVDRDDVESQDLPDLLDRLLEDSGHRRAEGQVAQMGQGLGLSHLPTQGLLRLQSGLDVEGQETVRTPELLCPRLDLGLEGGPHPLETATRLHPLGDVPHRCVDQTAVGRCHRRQTDVRDELGAVGPLGPQVPADTHGAHPRSGEVGRPLLGMGRALIRRQEFIHVPTEESTLLIAQEPMSHPVGHLDAARGVHQQDGVRGGLADRAVVLERPGPQSLLVFHDRLLGAVE